MHGVFSFVSESETGSEYGEGASEDEGMETMSEEDAGEEEEDEGASGSGFAYPDSVPRRSDSGAVWVGHCLLSHCARPVPL